MYDLQDVLSASRCSADVMNHVLCDYGDGNMGNGLRKVMGEMLTVGSQEGYKIGYNEGLKVGYSNGFIKGSIFSVCALGVIATGAWCVKKTIAIHKTKKIEKTFSVQTKEA